MISQSIKTPSIDIRGFLENGAFLVGQDHRVYVAWGSSEKRSQPCAASFYVTDFYLKNKTPWLKFEFFREVSKEELIEALRQTELLPCQAKFSSPSYEDWACKFSKSQEFIQRGELQKIVPVICEQASHSLSLREKASLVCHSLQSSLGMAYGHWEAGQGVVGVTPEILFSLDSSKTRLQTMSLAGTHSLEKEEGSLLRSEKDRREHDFVIAGIAEALGSLGEVKIGGTHEFKNEYLKHLRTFIHLDGKQPLHEQELVGRLHPTPALGVSPSRPLDNYMDILEEKRGSYGAPFGCVGSQQESQFIVAIRNMAWQKNTLSLWSGCGLVASSDELLEWEELKLKRNSVKALLGVVK